MRKLFNLGALLMLATCAGFICSCNDDVEETPPATVTPPGGDATENKDTHEYVDLGLPSGTLWATCNVGASKPEEYGNYFAWGETQPKTTCSWSTYKYCKGTKDTMTKYCTSKTYGTVDNKTELEAMDDAATANWGKNWQMPSKEQFEELINSRYTTTTWISLPGCRGCMIVSKSNGNRIILPAAGVRHDLMLPSWAGSIGYYWSRSLDASGTSNVYGLWLGDEPSTYSDPDRYYGQSVRPVRVKK